MAVNSLFECESDRLFGPRETSVNVAALYIIENQSGAAQLSLPVEESGRGRGRGAGVVLSNLLGVIRQHN